MIKLNHNSITGSNYYFQPVEENKRTKRRKTKKTVKPKRSFLESKPL